MRPENITPEMRETYARFREQIAQAETIEQFGDAMCGPKTNGTLVVIGGEDHIFTLGGLRFAGFINLLSVIERQLAAEIAQAGMLTWPAGEA